MAKAKYPDYALVPCETNALRWVAHELSCTLAGLLNELRRELITGSGLEGPVRTRVLTPREVARFMKAGKRLHVPLAEAWFEARLEVCWGLRPGWPNTDAYWGPGS